MELLRNIGQLTVDIVSNWAVFQALLVFPIFVLGVGLLQRVKAGEHLSPKHLLPRESVVWSVLNNITLNLCNSLVWAGLLTGFYMFVDRFWDDVAGFGTLSVFEGWPFLVQIIILLILIDFVYYWIHRMLHSPALWDIHALHHSDRHMNFSTVMRVHVLEMVFMSAVALILIGWMDMPAEAAGIAWIIRLWHSFYIHSDLPFDHGRFRKVLASPNYHRWHHADDPAVYGKNLCDMFPAWDLMFGTHHDPDWCTMPSGVSDAPDDALRGQLHPFICYAKHVSDWVRRPFRSQA